MNQKMVEKMERWGAEKKTLSGRLFYVLRPHEIGMTPENEADLSSRDLDIRSAARKRIQAASRAFESDIGYKNTFSFTNPSCTIGGQTFTDKEADRMENEYRETRVIRYDIENDSLEVAYSTPNKYTKAILDAIRNAD
jgi:hypothetical protein